MAANSVNLQAYTLQRRPAVGQRIREARTTSGWTQEHVAQYLGCSRRRVNRVEQGITDFGVFELELLAQVWQIPITDFLDQ